MFRKWFFLYIFFLSIYQSVMKSGLLVSNSVTSPSPQIAISGLFFLSPFPQTWLAGGETSGGTPQCEGARQQSHTANLYWPPVWKRASISSCWSPLSLVRYITICNYQLTFNIQEWNRNRLTWETGRALVIVLLFYYSFIKL